MPTALKLQAPWEKVKETLKENDVTLTDDDLEYKEGEEDALINRLAKKMKKEPSAVKEYIESVSANSGRAG